MTVNKRHSSSAVIACSCYCASIHGVAPPPDATQNSHFQQDITQRQTKTNKTNKANIKILEEIIPIDDYEHLEHWDGDEHQYEQYGFRSAKITKFLNAIIGTHEYTTANEEATSNNDVTCNSIYNSARQINIRKLRNSNQTLYALNLITTVTNSRQARATELREEDFIVSTSSNNTGSISSSNRSRNLQGGCGNKTIWILDDWSEGATLLRDWLDTEKPKDDKLKLCMSSEGAYKESEGETIKEENAMDGPLLGHYRKVSQPPHW